MAAIVFFTLLLLSSTITIHARESQFFAKVSNNNPKDLQPLNTNQQDPKTQPQPQDSYGLYGHGSGQLPPSTTTNNLPANLPANLPENYNPVAYTTPIHSSTQDLAEEFKEPEAYQYNGDSAMDNSQKQEQFVGTNGGDMYNTRMQEQFEGTNGGNTYNTQKQDQFVGTNGGGNTYNTQKQGMSDTRFLENGRYYYAGDNTYNSQKQGLNDASFMETEDGGNTYNSQNQGDEMYNSQKQGMGEARYSTATNNGNMYNTEKQGMSDTRFLESGKYYYDLNSENANMNSRGFGLRNGYNTNGYYGNNDNTHYRFNSNGGYQNQEEFQDDQDDQFNP